MTSKTYNFSATVTSAENQSATATQPFVVASGSGGNTALAGCTIKASVTGATLATFETNFGNLVYPIGVKKIYFQGQNNPPPTVISGNAPLQAASINSEPVILCFEPTYFGTTSDPGPATLSSAAVGSGGTFAAGAYFWKITAVNAAGLETGPSNETTKTLVLDGSCTLTWTAGGPGITGYNIYRGTTTGNENTLVATVGVVTTYTDTGIAGTAKTPPANWAGGADKPALGTYASGNSGTILGDQHDMVATITGLQSAGLTIEAVCMWQECDNFGKYQNEMGGSAPVPTADQITFLYNAHYMALHSTGVPVIVSYGGYQQNLATASQATTLMPFKTYLRPNDVNWCDGLTIDRYADGYHTLSTTPYSQGPGNVPTSSERWGYGDMADFAGLPFGWIEAGNSASGGLNPAENYMVEYIIAGSYTDPTTNTLYEGDPINSIEATFKYRLENNLPCLPFAWYMSANSTDTGSNGPNGIFNAGDFRIALLQTLYKTLTGKTA